MGSTAISVVYPVHTIACLLQGKPFLQFSSLGMAPHDWWWDYFDKSDEHFGTNRTHHKAFCKACIQNAEEQLKAADAIAFSQGLLDAIWPSSQVHLEAMRHIEPICGKWEWMKTHLKSCLHIKESVKLHNDGNKNLEGPTNGSGSLEQ